MRSLSILEGRNATRDAIQRAQAFVKRFMNPSVKTCVVLHALRLGQGYRFYRGRGRFYTLGMSPRAPVPASDPWGLFTPTRGGLHALFTSSAVDMFFTSFLWPRGFLKI